MRRRTLVKTPKWLVLTVAFATLTLVAYGARQVPSFADVKFAFPVGDVLVVDRGGHIVDARYSGQGPRRGPWFRLEEIDPRLPAAILASVDPRFYWHPGWDPWLWLNGRQPTLTSRVETLLRQGAPDANRPGLSRIMRALRVIGLELTWGKGEILEAYLNLTLFRRDLQGVAAASAAIVDKVPTRLSQSEAVMLAALSDSPNDEEAVRLRGRACAIVRELESRSDCLLPEVSHFEHVIGSLRLHPFSRLAPTLPVDRTPGVGIARSEIDREVQWMVLRTLHAARATEAAAVVVESRSGRVVSYVGNTRGARGAESEPDHLSSVRAIGTAVQPLFYALALDEKLVTVPAIGPVFRDRSDLLAIRLLDEIGDETVKSRLFELGLSHWGGLVRPTMATGDLPATWLEMTNAYRLFANAGKWSPLRFSPDITSESASRTVLSPESAFLIADLLTLPPHPDVGTVGWLAGVHSDGRSRTDSWAIGFSDQYTVAVWMASPGEGAARIWRAIMAKLHAHRPSASPLAPPGVIRDGGNWYLVGTEPGSGRQRPPARFGYPRNREVVNSVAPMIIKILSSGPDQSLFVNGRRVGPAQPYIRWTPEPGRAVLELRDSRGNTVDRVVIRVRDDRLAASLR